MDEYLITRPEASYLLRVSGDSMTGAGIVEGDLVVVEKGREPKSGDIVIAEVDGEWTMKYFRKQGKHGAWAGPLRSLIPVPAVSIRRPLHPDCSLHARSGRGPGNARGGWPGGFPPV